MPSEPRPCNTHAELFNFTKPLPNLKASLNKPGKIKLVAIGSSSTAGEGGVVPYPARLEILLREHFDDRVIEVLNRGVGGEEATSELLRLQRDVISERPSLVIWQVGTNAVFRNDEFDFGDVINAIVKGVRTLKGSIDVVIMDSQFVPAVVDGEKLKLSEELVGRIARTAEDESVNVFRRFDLMRHWVDHDHVPIDDLVREGDEKRLHTGDWATDCVSRALFQSITARLEADGVT
jgi:acyl-CoA thioesterase-1